ncbi:MAG: hypothetical protein SFW67_35525 [Myxococcaceae bacterium]|nr:hypothetical protein [Myxococcaceae bacterium]
MSAELLALALICWAATSVVIAILARSAFIEWLRYLSAARGPTLEALQADVARLQRDVAELVDARRADSRAALARLGK